MSGLKSFDVDTSISDVHEYPAHALLVQQARHRIARALRDSQVCEVIVILALDQFRVVRNTHLRAQVADRLDESVGQLV